MKNTIYKTLLLLFFCFHFCFAVSTTFISAPKISRIRGMITISGSGFSNLTYLNHVYAGNVISYIDTVANINTTLGTSSTLIFKNPLGKTAKGGVFITNTSLFQTFFYQNITNSTFSGGNAGQITPTTFDIQTKVLTFQPSSFLIADYIGIQKLSILISDSATNQIRTYQHGNDFNGNFAIDSMQIN